MGLTGEEPARHNREMDGERTCAITGSSGYVGGCLARRFAAQGWEVLELIRHPDAGQRAVRFELGRAMVPAVLSGVNTLVHCAYDFVPLHWRDIHTVNVEGSRSLFEAARAAGVAKIVFISSLSAFEGCRSLYGRAKLEIERIALDHGALVVRPGLVYGKRPGAMFGRLVSLIRRSPLIPLIGNGSQIQFLVRDDDLCVFIEKYSAGTIARAPCVLPAAHERPWRFKALLREIARALGRRPVFVPLPWQLVWLGLKAAETCGLRPGFRSDSVVSLMHQDPRPDFAATRSAGLVCRPFEADELRP